MNKDINQEPAFNDDEKVEQAAQEYTVKQAIEALEKTASALRRHDKITASYGEGDPRPPREVTRDQWFLAANNVLTSPLLTPAQKRKVKKLKTDMVISGKKK